MLQQAGDTARLPQVQRQELTALRELLRNGTDSLKAAESAWSPWRIRVLQLGAGRDLLEARLRWGIRSTLAAGKELVRSLDSLKHEESRLRRLLELDPAVEQPAAVPLVVMTSSPRAEVSTTASTLSDSSSECASLAAPLRLRALCEEREELVAAARGEPIPDFAQRVDEPLTDLAKMLAANAATEAEMLLVEGRLDGLRDRWEQALQARLLEQELRGDRLVDSLKRQEQGWQGRYALLLQQSANRAFIGEQLSEALAELRNTLTRTQKDLAAEHGALESSRLRTQSLDSLSRALGASLQESAERQTLWTAQLEKVASSYSELLWLAGQGLRFDPDQYRLASEQEQLLDKALEVAAFVWPGAELQVVLSGDSAGWGSDSSTIRGLDQRRALGVAHRAANWPGLAVQACWRNDSAAVPGTLQLGWFKGGQPLLDPAKFPQPAACLSEERALLEPLPLVQRAETIADSVVPAVPQGAVVPAAQQGSATKP
jgi:hypothetical protein